MASSPHEDGSDPVETEQAQGTMHGGALGGGAAVGVLVTAFIVGSVTLVLTLAGGAVVGLLVFGLVALLRDGRLRRQPSGDRLPPTLGVD
ncbi:MAG: hypothetical protein ACR2H3_04440, partial [Acidimicrobiales bacterium]